MQTKEKIILVAVLLVLAIGLFSLITSILAPPKADPLNDVVFEKIGGDDFLNVTIKYCLKIDENDIPDGSFSTNEGEIRYYNAKNITYADTSGIQDYFIIWKADCDKYDWVDTNQSVNQYVSCYLTGDVEGKCFVEYSYEHNSVYGVMLSTAKNFYSESQLMYKILGLNRDGFDLAYSYTQYGYGSYSSGPSDHYHTVVPDRYTLSRTDPGAYYDHYEYGDNYDIDDYLESEGYD